MQDNTPDSSHSSYYEAESFWADGALSDPGNNTRIENTIRMLPNGHLSLLDVGCGNGVFGHRLLEKRSDIDITGVDRSAAALKHVRFPSRMASIDNLPYAEKSFDVVSCLQVIEHLPNVIYQKSLAELARVARDQIIIGVPFNEDLEAETTQCPQCRTIFNLNLHLRNYNINDVENLFSAAGFNMVEYNFPSSKVRTKYLNEFVGLWKGDRLNSSDFLSPICPVCSYSEGDKTPLNSQNRSISILENQEKPFHRKLINAGIRTVSTFLPKEQVKGYWVIARYDRLKR